jgi:hypothetical protein
MFGIAKEKKPDRGANGLYHTTLATTRSLALRQALLSQT